MDNGNGEWATFLATGKIEDYLRYRLDYVSEADRAMLRADNDMSAIEHNVSTGDYYERDIYGDGDGPIGPTRGRI